MCRCWRYASDLATLDQRSDHVFSARESVGVARDHRERSVAWTVGAYIILEWDEGEAEDDEGRLAVPEGGSGLAGKQQHQQQQQQQPDLSAQQDLVVHLASGPWTRGLDDRER